ncbi:MAG: hypothetical protein AAF663_08280 [Planctomycetota bacterium]
MHRRRGRGDYGDDDFFEVVGRDGGGDQAAVGSMVVGQVGDGQVLGIEPSGGRPEQLVAGQGPGPAAGCVVSAGSGHERRGAILVHWSRL